MSVLLLTTVSCTIWVVILLLPWRPWSVRESLDSSFQKSKDVTQLLDLSDITTLIPARNEASTICASLQSLAEQGQGLNIILVDDQSTDHTTELAQQSAIPNLKIIKGNPLPGGWSGKLWALEQGRAHVKTSKLLLLDADINLQPGILAALLNKMQEDNRQFVSLMVSLRMEGFWERLLMPAFVYFFKLLYPFHLVNSPRLPWLAAAAGGCILLETHILEKIGAFGSLREALIDDCALARKVKQQGYRTWLGLTHSAHSLRKYQNLSEIWNMVARTAFTQLNYSAILLLLATIIMVLAYWLPVIGLFFANTRLISIIALCAMMVGYIPVLRYYQCSHFWLFALPVIGTLYLAMTWSSALRYWGGQRSAWKERVYDR